MSFIPPTTSTSGRLHSDFVCLLFLQPHRETDRFFAVSGVQLPHSTSVLLHYHRVVFSSHLRSRIGSILGKAVVLRITLNIDDRCSSPPHNPVYVSRVDPTTLSSGLSSHQRSYISFLFNSRFID